ncbi:MAG: hypothetical protein U0795_26780 [Pirellulales bacterium]
MDRTTQSDVEFSGEPSGARNPTRYGLGDLLIDVGLLSVIAGVARVVLRSPDSAFHPGVPAVLTLTAAGTAAIGMLVARYVRRNVGGFFWEAFWVAVTLQWALLLVWPLMNALRP